MVREFGKGFTISALSRLLNFYKLFQDDKIVATLSQQLSWSHFVVLIAINQDLQREFYTHLSIRERWSVRTLRDRIDSMLYEPCIAKVTPTLNETIGEANWKVDTQNPEKILTVSTDTLDEGEVIKAVEKAGYKAEKIA